MAPPDAYGVIFFMLEKLGAGTGCRTGNLCHDASETLSSRERAPPGALYRVEGKGAGIWAGPASATAGPLNHVEARACDRETRRSNGSDSDHRNPGQYTTAPTTLEKWRNRQIAATNPAAMRRHRAANSDDDVRDRSRATSCGHARARPDLTTSPTRSFMAHHIGDSGLSTWGRDRNDCAPG